jgi:glycosyltransferase involved in cell wall biosynthesis
MISVVVITHNRRKLLRHCVENVLLRTSGETGEILVWDNGSTDETSAYLESVQDSRLRAVRSPVNLGHSAYRRAVELITGDHLIMVDDDVVDAPPGWDAVLLHAFRRLSDVGFLATDLRQNEHNDVAVMRHRVRAHLYEEQTENGVRILTGPVGGWCAMTARDIYHRAGGFRVNVKETYWLWDAAYIEDIARIGYRAAILADLAVLHGAPWREAPPVAKVEFARRLRRRTRGKNQIKRALLALPAVRSANAKHAWFQPPDDEWERHITRVALGNGDRGPS